MEQLLQWDDSDIKIPRDGEVGFIYTHAKTFFYSLPNPLPRASWRPLWPYVTNSLHGGVLPRVTVLQWIYFLARNLLYLQSHGLCHFSSGILPAQVSDSFQVWGSNQLLKKAGLSIFGGDICSVKCDCWVVPNSVVYLPSWVLSSTTGTCPVLPLDAWQMRLHDLHREPVHPMDQPHGASASPFIPTDS